MVWQLDVTWHCKAAQSNHNFMKLVLVTVYYRGSTNIKMVSGTVREDGSVSISKSILDKMAHDLGCIDGDTYSYG